MRIDRIEHPTEEAFVLQIGDRFFCGFGKNKRVQTAWSLAGAKMFLCTWKLDEVVEVLKAT